MAALKKLRIVNQNLTGARELVELRKLREIYGRRLDARI